jgi:aspartate/methionine/tyrosine aminotransferase
MPSLTAQITQFLRESGGSSAVDPAQIVLAETTQSLLQLVLSTCKHDPSRGEELVAITPLDIVSTEQICQARGLRVRSVPLRPQEWSPHATGSWSMDWRELEASLSESVRLLYLSSPNLPLSAAFTQSELHELAGILQRFPNITVLCDESGSQHLRPGVRFASLRDLPELRDRCVTFFRPARALLSQSTTTTSTTAAAAAAAVGFATASPAMAHNLNRAQTAAGSRPNFEQQAALQAILEEGVQDTRTTLQQVHESLLPILASAGLLPLTPDVLSSIVVDCSGVCAAAGILPDSASYTPHTPLADRPDTRTAQWLASHVKISGLTPLSHLFAPKDRHLANSLARLCLDAPLHETVSSQNRLSEWYLDQEYDQLVEHAQGPAPRASAPFLM